MALTNVFGDRLKRALGSHYSPGVPIQDCYASFKAEYGGSKDAVVVGMVASVDKLWTDWSGAEKVLSDFAHEQASGVSAHQCHPQLWEYCIPSGCLGSHWLLTAPMSCIGQLQKILNSYKQVDRYRVTVGDVCYVGVQSRYKLSGDMIWKKMDASVRGDTTKWFVLQGVKPKKYNECKACVMGLVDAVILEGKQDFDAPPFSQTLLNDYARATCSTDVLFLLGAYCALADCSPDVCDQCMEDNDRYPEEDDPRREHSTLHGVHYRNAKGFLHVTNKRQACSHACDMVQGNLRYAEKSSTRHQRFAGYCMKALEKLDRALDEPMVAAAIFLKRILPHGLTVTEFFDCVVGGIVAGSPKQQGYVFTGPVNSGKSTLASAVMSLCEGTALNVNCPKDRLWVEFGRALDRYCVCFEDTKGVPKAGHDLPWGEGMSNLDNNRDCLDGLFKVGLERKHQNKVDAHFPPWILTCNEYVIPPTVLARCRERVLDFVPLSADVQAYMKEWSVDLRFLASGACLMLAYCMFGDLSCFDAELSPLATRVAEKAADIPWGEMAERLDPNEDSGIPLSQASQSFLDLGNPPWPVSHVRRVMEAHERGNRPPPAPFTAEDSQSPFKTPDPYLAIMQTSEPTDSEVGSFASEKSVSSPFGFPIQSDEDEPGEGTSLLSTPTGAPRPPKKHPPPRKSVIRKRHTGGAGPRKNLLTRWLNKEEDGPPSPPKRLCPDPQCDYPRHGAPGDTIETLPRWCKRHDGTSFGGLILSSSEDDDDVFLPLTQK